jgi:hypothetical protein
MAAALYALPPLALDWISGSAIGSALAVVDLGVLGYAAVRFWSPLVVLALVLLSCAGFAFWLVVAPTDNSVIAWVGGSVTGIALAASQLRRGAHIFWAVPAGWLAVTLWFVIAR